MNDKVKYNLLDLFKKIQAENDGKQEALIKFRYVPNNSEYSEVIAEAELKPSRSE